MRSYLRSTAVVLGKLCLSALTGFGLMSPAALAAPSTMFTSICTLDESCAVEDSTLVAFGNGQTFAYRTMSGNFICSPDTFGVTEVNGNQRCWTLDPVRTALDSSSSSSSSGATLANPQALPAIKPGLYALVSRFSGKALSLDSAPETQKVTQLDYQAHAQQLWMVEVQDNGYYAITDAETGAALEVADWSTQDGARLSVAPWLNSWNQHWSIIPVDQGFVRIVSRFNQRALDVYEMNRKNHGVVCTWTYWGGENQHWLLLPIAAQPQDEETSTP